MTKTLVLTRHAKSDWDDPLADDHARVLAARGRAAAPLIGQWLATHGYLPDIALVSSATRARETWDFIAQALPPPAVVRIVDALYLASPATMLGVLRRAEGDCAILVGHNPGIAALAGQLVATPPRHRDFGRFPTGATLVARFDIDAWVQLQPGTGRSVDFVVPRELA